MIHIFLHPHAAGFDLSQLKGWESEDYLLPFKQREYGLFPSGRAALSRALSNINLKKRDEVFIANSSGQTYIASCVTCTIFNFCQPSRVLTRDTRAILVIHEYGVPHPQLEELLEEGSRRNIPVIEDCAHSFDSKSNDQLIGTFGDYAFYSLPKIYPMGKGGILSWKKIPTGDAYRSREDDLERIEREFHDYGPYLRWFSERRRENYATLARLFPEEKKFLNINGTLTPYFFGVFLEDCERIRNNHQDIEWGSTLVENLLLIPTNPMIDANYMVRKMQDVLEKV